MSAEDRKDFQADASARQWMAWRRLQLENESQIAGRINTMLMSLLLRMEMQTGERWNSTSIQIAVVSQRAPEQMLSYLRTCAVQARCDWQQFKPMLQEYRGERILGQES